MGNVFNPAETLLPHLYNRVEGTPLVPCVMYPQLTCDVSCSYGGQFHGSRVSPVLQWTTICSLHPSLWRGRPQATWPLYASLMCWAPNLNSIYILPSRVNASDLLLLPHLVSLTWGHWYGALWCDALWNVQMIQVPSDSMMVEDGGVNIALMPDINVSSPLLHMNVHCFDSPFWQGWKRKQETEQWRRRRKKKLDGQAPCIGGYVDLLQQRHPT